MAKAEKAAEAEHQGILDESGEGFTFDMASQEEDAGFPIVPKGTYDGQVDEVTYGISKNSGNPMWTVIFLVTQAEVADKNLKVRNYVPFKPDQMGRVKQFLARIGASEFATADFNPKKIADDGSLIGKTCRLRLDVRKSDEYGDSNEVKGILPAGTGASAAAGAGGFAM